MALLLCVLLILPIPEKSWPEDLVSKHNELTDSLSSYDALIWVGFFCLGRWLINKDKQKSNQHMDFTGKTPVD
jgi:hypothetical protein